MQVNLLVHTPSPLAVIWLAYRTCYDDRTPQELWAELNDPENGLTQEDVVAFITERMAVGHTTPLEQVDFTFAISNISRACSHQLVRHRVGFSPNQQSQRYVKMDPLSVVPPVSISRDHEAFTRFAKHRDETEQLYRDLLERGIPAEDARFVLPEATTTNLLVKLNMVAMLHMGDQRLCTRAQWEFRHLVAQMRAEIMRAVPELGKFIQPKCGSRRHGACDESHEDYLACPLSSVRPHKDDMGTYPPPGVLMPDGDITDELWKEIER